jgi:hypothetical protein
MRGTKTTSKSNRILVFFTEAISSVEDSVVESLVWGTSTVGSNGRRRVDQGGTWD